MKRLSCLIALAVVAAMPAFAQSEKRARSESFASDKQTVAVMANTSGVNGAQFRTHVALLNPTAAAFPVNVTLYDASGTTREAVITLAAGELKTYENFLDDVFDYSGGGAVTFESPESTGGTNNNRFIVVAEIYTATSGRFGTSIPVLEFAGSDSPSFSAGVTVSSTQRTNVGCFNQSSAPNKITATVLDGTGTQSLGTVELNLAANAWGQTAITTVVSNGSIEFEPSDSAVCYAVVVDSTTNDGRFISAAEYRP